MKRAALGRAIKVAVGSILEPLERRSLLSFSPTGGEFRINTYTTNQQGVPDVAMDAAGNFAVTWASTNQDGSVSGIYAQRFNSIGVPQGAEFRVNTHTTGSQLLPTIAMDDAGNFVIAWEGVGAIDGNGIYAQRYNATGTPQGGQFQVNTYTTNSQARAAAAMDADGDFVITWNGEGTGDFPGTSGIFAQRFDETGTPQGGEFKVNTYTNNSQLEPCIAMNGNGDFVIAWNSSGQDGSFNSIHAQRYNSAGIAQGAEFRANTYTTSQQWFPGVGMDSDGDFVIAWESFEQDGSSSGIHAQRYNSAGAALGTEFRVNTYTTDSQMDPFVAMSDNGNFVVAWESNLQDGENSGIYAQAYDASGAPQGTEFRVNTYTSHSQVRAAVAMGPSGNAVISWQSFQDPGTSPSDSVFAQRYSLVNAAPTVTAADFRFQTAPQKLTFTFDRDVSGNDPGDISIADITLIKIGGGAVPTLTMLPYGTDGTNVASFTMNTLLADGNYRATINAAGVTDNGNPMAANYLFDFFIIGGDANHDRIVNVYDLLILANNWLGTGKTYSQADFDYNGTVNATDLGILGLHWQQILALPAAPLPEVPVSARATARGAVRTPTRVIELVQ